MVLIGLADLLPALYTEVLIPEAVAEELNQPGTPEPVRRWMAHRPSWLQVVPLTAGRASVSVADLDLCEHDAILLALQLKADLVLMDEREGVEEARRLGLTVTGTLGVLDRAAEREVIELAPARGRAFSSRGNPSVTVGARIGPLGCWPPMAGEGRNGNAGNNRRANWPPKGANAEDPAGGFFQAAR